MSRHHMSELQAWVNKLGAMSIAEIRKLLQDEGISGSRASARYCPIASLLTAKTGKAVLVSDTISDGMEVTSDRHNSPDSVLGFISDFDSGCYPELDKWEIARQLDRQERDRLVHWLT